MTPPRYSEAGREIAFYRGTLMRLYLFRPDPVFVQGVGFLLAVSCQRYDVGLTSFCMQSTHYHGTAIDRRGNFPEFLQFFDSLLARWTNFCRGRRDTALSGDGPELTLIADANAAVEMAAYGLANPVQDGAVRHGRDWPGLRTTPQCHSRPPRVFDRPKGFFRQSGAGCLPERAELVVVKSNFFDDPKEWTQRLSQAVADKEQAAREENTRGFMGAKACLRVPWDRQATTPRPPGRPDPVVAREKEAGRALRQLIKDFRAAYAECRRLWSEGARDITWPQGTWFMARLLNPPTPTPLPDS